MILLACLLLLAAGCAAPPPPEIPPVPPPRSVRDVSQSLTVRIYFDATSSMSGFAAVKSSSGFVAFVQRLEQAVAIGWRSSSIECYKFGLKVSRLPGDRCYLLPVEGGFYDLTGKDDVTRIDQVLGEIDGKSMAVILTDLYQDDADLGAIFQAVKRTVFARNLSIGIAGILSPFSGTVYDIGLYKDSREWNRERPLYALVIGHKGDVIHFFEEVSKPPLSVRRDQLLILSADLLERFISWDSVPRQEPDRVAEDERIIPRDMSSAGVKGFRLQSSEDPCGLRLRVVPQYSPFHPYFDLTRASALLPTLDLKLFRNGTATAVPSAAVAARFVPATQPRDSSQDARAALELTWQPKQLLRGGEYLLALRVAFDPASVRFPSFVSSWSVPAGEALAGERFDGSKTQNLQEFVMGLWRILLAQHGESVGTLYFYFQK